MNNPETVNAQTKTMSNYISGVADKGRLISCKESQNTTTVCQENTQRASALKELWLCEKHRRCSLTSLLPQTHPMPEGNKSSISLKDLCSHVPCSVLHNSQAMDTNVY